MTSGWLLLGLVTLICIGVFLSGLRFSRVTANPLAGKRIGRFPVQGSQRPASDLRRLGRLFMIAAPVFWLVFAALVFGLLGPVDGIQTIKL